MQGDFVLPVPFITSSDRGLSAKASNIECNSRLCWLVDASFSWRRLGPGQPVPVRLGVPKELVTGAPRAPMVWLLGTRRLGGTYTAEIAGGVDCVNCPRPAELHAANCLRPLRRVCGARCAMQSHSYLFSSLASPSHHHSLSISALPSRLVETAFITVAAAASARPLESSSSHCNHPHQAPEQTRLHLVPLDLSRPQHRRGRFAQFSNTRRPPTLFPTRC